MATDLLHCCPIARPRGLAPDRPPHKLEVFTIPGAAFEIVEVLVCLGPRRRSILELLDWETLAELALLAEADYERIAGTGEEAA